MRTAMASKSYLSNTILKIVAESDKPLSPNDVLEIMENYIPGQTYAAIRQSMYRMSLSDELDVLNRGLYTISLKGRLILESEL